MSRSADFSIALVVSVVGFCFECKSR